MKTGQRQSEVEVTTYVTEANPQLVQFSSVAQSCPTLWDPMNRSTLGLPKAQYSENEDHGIRSHHFVGNRWGNSGNSVRLYFSGSKITADGDCSHELKRRLLLERKVMTDLESILKSRDITLPTKVHLVKAMVFPVIMYGCESWTMKKTEH